MMDVIDTVLPASDAESAHPDFRRDSITLTWEERRRGHGRRRSDGGLEFGLSLATGTVLGQGDGLVSHQARVLIRVIEAAEPVYVIHPGSPQQWAFYAFHIGNRHQPVMIGERELICLQDPAVKSLFEHLHVPYTAEFRPFCPAVETSHEH